MYAGTIYKDCRQIALALAVLGTVSSASLAFAQTLNVQQEEDPRRANNAARITKEVSPSDSGTDDKERVQASYQPKGIPLGSFILFPAIENEVLFNSNIYSTRDNVKADIVDKVMPEIKLRSRFSEHAVNFTARAEQFLYRTHDAENHLDANIMADGRYDLSRDWEANGLLSFNRSYEDRGSPDAVAGEHPTLTNTYSTRLGSKQRSGRMTYAAVLTLDRRLYGDVSTSTGTAINNSDRNRIESEGTVSASYELFPGYAAVAELSANRRRYDDRRDDLGFERSSWGYAARTGVSVDLSQLVRGDFTVGYMAQDYEDSRFTDPHGLSVRASFNWTPSKLTVVVPSLERSIQETTASQTSALVRTSAGLLVRHELERNIVLTASGKVFNDYYEGTRQSNWTYEARLRGIWALAPEYYVGAETGTRIRTSTVKSSEFTQTVMLLRLGAHL